MKSVGIRALIALCCFVGVACSAHTLHEEDVADVAPQQHREVESSEPEALTQDLAQSLVNEVRQEVARLRQLEFKRDVPVKVIDDAAARSYMTERLTSFQSLEEMRRGQRVYQLLGLVPPEMDIIESYMEALEEQAAGFYDPARSAYYLLDDIPPALAPILTAHELTHALEDQHFNLDSRIREHLNDDDRIFAISSVHEGSATLLMTHYLTQGLMNGTLSADVLSAGNLDITGADALQKMPVLLQRQLVGPYVLGALFLARNNMMSMVTRGYPAEDVDRVYDAGPLSSEQILHPEKYWDPQQRDDPTAVSLSGVGNRLGHEWKATAAGVLGELTLAVLAGADEAIDPQRAMLQGGSSWTNDAASGWGGDRWEIWESGDEQLVLLLTVWDTPEDAAEFAAALTQAQPLMSKLRGERVAVLAGENASERIFLLDAMLAAEPAIARETGRRR